MLLDEANSSTDVAINMDAVDRERYTTQMQLIEQDVSANTDAGCRVLYLLSLHRLVFCVVASAKLHCLKTSNVFFCPFTHE